MFFAKFLTHRKVPNSWQKVKKTGRDSPGEGVGGREQKRKRYKLFWIEKNCATVRDSRRGKAGRAGGGGSFPVQSDRNVSKASSSSMPLSGFVGRQKKGNSTQCILGKEADLTLAISGVISKQFM